MKITILILLFSCAKVYRLRTYWTTPVFIDDVFLCLVERQPITFINWNYTQADAAWWCDFYGAHLLTLQSEAEMTDVVSQTVNVMKWGTIDLILYFCFYTGPKKKLVKLKVRLPSMFGQMYVCVFLSNDGRRGGMGEREGWKRGVEREGRGGGSVKCYCVGCFEGINIVIID